MRRRDLIVLLSGATVGWPAGARGQQPMPVIAYVGAAPPSKVASNIAGFRQGLSEAGYIDGQDLVLEHHWSRATMIGCPH